MKPHILGLLVLCLVIASIDGRRKNGGNRQTSSGARKTPSPPKQPSQSNTHHSQTFLNRERDHQGSSQIKPAHSSPTHSSNPNSPSAPPLNSRPSGSSYGNPVQDQHQKSTSSNSHSSPYQPQPPSNPHYQTSFPAPPPGVSAPNSHGFSNPPYPVSQPNHPHPSHPSPPSNGAFGQTHYNPANSGNHNSYPPLPQPGGGNFGQPHSSYPSAPQYPSVPNHGNVPAYQPPPFPGSSHPPQQPHYQQPHYQQPHYSAPQYTAPHYSAPVATQAFVPGKIVVVESERNRGGGFGSSIGTAIAGGVAGGVAAGATSAIVSRLFSPSSSHPQTFPSPPAIGTPTSTVTHTTNNYYYGQPSEAGSNPQPNQSNQPPTAVSSATVQANPAQASPAQASPAQSPASGNPSTPTNGVASKTPENQPPIIPPPANFVSDDDLMKLSEELFEKQDQNLNQYVEVNVQKQVVISSEGAVPDEAPEPLFKVKPELDTVPTVKALKALYHNYQRDGTVKEEVTRERHSEENAFLDEVIKTPVMSKALDWLTAQKHIEADPYEQKDLLKRMWFSNFEGTSSGFERIFLAEKFPNGAIIGMHNWIYFAHLESQQNVNYLGHTVTKNLNGKGSALKLNYQSDGITVRNMSMLIGTTPELELSLYTVCFHARRNNWCPVSLGGVKFFMLTQFFDYFGKQLIDLGFPGIVD